ncbi:MAG: hypothetical protein WD048_04115 [Chitinophagales bacterium]
MRFILCLFIIPFYLFSNEVFSQEDESFEFNPERIKEPDADPEEDEKVRMPEGYERPSKNVLKISPTALLFGQIPLTGELRLMYEMATAPRQSSFIGVSLNYSGVFLSLVNILDTTLTNQKYQFFGGRVQVAYRFYLLKKKEAPNGLYVAPHFSFNYAKFKLKNGVQYQNFYYINGNFLFGYQLVAGHFAFDVCTGLGYRNNFTDYFNGARTRRTQLPEDRPAFFQHLKPTLNISLGYAF